MSEIVAPWIDFSHAVHDASQLRPTRHARISAVAERGDGFLLRERHRAVYMANGDCAVGVLVGGDALVAMHLGLACLYRDDGGPTVLELASRALEAPPAEQAFFVGCGIGPCCLGYDHAIEANAARGRMLQARYGADVLPGAATRGPRRGQTGYDHLLMATRLAEALGVGHVEADRHCTSCAGVAPDEDPAMGTYFSNVRDLARRRERNLVLVAR